MEKSERVVVATPGPINPLKTTLGSRLSILCPVPSVDGPKAPRLPTHLN